MCKARVRNQSDSGPRTQPQLPRLCDDRHPKVEFTPKHTIVDCAENKVLLERPEYLASSLRYGEHFIAARSSLFGV